jgi:hypothetical protein
MPAGQAFNFSNIANAFRTGTKPAPNANPAADPSQNLPGGPQGNTQQQNTVVNPATGQSVNSSTGMPNAQNPNADPNNNLPGTQQNNTGNPSSPLDTFKDLFTIDPNKKPSKNPMEDPLFALDPKKLGEAVSQMDFTRGINPESIAKAFPQGVDSIELGNVLNHVARSAYMLSTQMIVGMMERGFKTNNGRLDSSMSGKFRDLAIQNSSTKHPALKHAAAQPVVAALKQQIASQNPNFTPQEVQDQAESYFLAMGKAMTTLGEENNDPNNPNKKGGAGEQEDWSQFLNGG